VTFAVQQAYDKDVGRGIARIDSKAMKFLTATAGDIVEIRGKHRTVARCLPLNSSDEGKGIIRVDSLLQRNMGSMIGNTIVAMEILAIKDDRIYTITFGAQSDEYSDYLPLVEEMLDSLVIQKQEHRAADMTTMPQDASAPNVSASELLVQLELPHKNIDRGDDQIMTISVADKRSSSVVHNAMVRGEVFTPSSKFMTLDEKITDEHGKVSYLWPVGNSAETGEFTVVVRVSSNGYESISISDTYNVRPKNRAPI